MLPNVFIVHNFVHNFVQVHAIMCLGERGSNESHDRIISDLYDI